eukprot:CAMPEP_0173125608 /NCGR_PEP_ID=MMETSP1102-20130122/56535_1 /TAXON_ID=49646 /ORGANISM="Geminigera sp., Strain Caron Lab Isolate" /LENGTH=92 /DNA_ID=CAMNT_0014034543 /DNA_START=242 /DNA_END=520 /DNA_ORIENTATION=+
MKLIIARDPNRLPALLAANRILYFVNFNVECPDGSRSCSDTVGAGLHDLRAFFAEAKREHSLQGVFAFAAASDDDGSAAVAREHGTHHHCQP